MKARSQESFAKKWTGCVEIKTGDNAARITSIQTDKDGKVKNLPGDVPSLKISLDDFPKASKRVVKPHMDSKKFRIRMDEDGSAVETVTPYSGVYRARLVGLGPKTQDGSFKLIHKVYNEGTEKENRHEEFIAIYVITDGPFREVELPGYYLHYKFEEDPSNEGFTQFNTVNNAQATQLHKLIAWAEVHGDILEDDVRWYSEEDGTILEELEERALNNDREVNLVFEKGYIKLIQPVEDYEEVDVDEPEAMDAALDSLDDVDKAFPPEDVKLVKEISEVVTKSKHPLKAKPAAKKVKAAASEDDDL